MKKAIKIKTKRIDSMQLLGIPRYRIESQYTPDGPWLLEFIPKKTTAQERK